MRRDAVFEELAARAHVVAIPLARREGPRLEQRDPLTAWIGEQKLVELVVGERGMLDIDAGVAQRPRVVAQLRPDERQQRSLLRPGVQADRNAAVGQRDVRILELIADRDRLKAERSIELERARERLRGKRELEELSEHARPCPRWDSSLNSGRLSRRALARESSS